MTEISEIPPTNCYQAADSLLTRHPWARENVERVIGRDPLADDEFDWLEALADAWTAAREHDPALGRLLARTREPRSDDAWEVWREALPTRRRRPPARRHVVRRAAYGAPGRDAAPDEAAGVGHQRPGRARRARRGRRPRLGADHPAQRRLDPGREAGFRRVRWRLRPSYTTRAPHRSVRGLVVCSSRRREISSGTVNVRSPSPARAPRPRPATPSRRDGLHDAHRAALTRRAVAHHYLGPLLDLRHRLFLSSLCPGRRGCRAGPSSRVRAGALRAPARGGLFPGSVQAIQNGENRRLPGLETGLEALEHGRGVQGRSRPVSRPVSTVVHRAASAASTASSDRTAWVPDAAAPWARCRSAARSRTRAAAC